MARFVFKMQNLLNIKFKIEEQCKVEFAIVNKKYLEEVDKQNALEIKKMDYEQQLRDCYSGSLKIIEIRHLQDGIEKLKILIKAQIEVVKSAEKKLEKAREKLNEAIKERKIYEKLREKAFEQFLIELKAEEDKITDETVSYRYTKTTDSK